MGGIFKTSRDLLLLLSLCGVGNARVLKRDTTYSFSQRNSAYAASFGQYGQTTTLDAGNTYWLSGGSTHNVFGNLNINGQLLLSQTDFLRFTPFSPGMVSTYTGHDTTNGNLQIGSNGVVSLNDFGALTSPEYDWDLRTFTNNGVLQWCGRGDTYDTTYQLYCDIDCYNYGLIDWEQYYDNLGVVNYWRNTVLYPANTSAATTVYNIYNYGAFRMINLFYHQIQNVYGTGCWIIGPSAGLYLEDGAGINSNPNYGPTLPQQSIYMTDNTGVLHMDPLVYAFNPNFGAAVFGYGDGNAIEFTEPIATSGGYSYDAVNGVLKVTFVSGNTVSINIGVGYVAASFSVALNPQFYNPVGFNAIFYSGVVPVQTVPTKCSVSVPTCQNPAETAGPYAATSATPAPTETPNNPRYIYTTVAYSGTGTITGPITTTLVTATGARVGTIEVIEPPGVLTVTTTEAYTGTSSITGPITTTAATRSGTRAGTVIVYTPRGSYTTTTAPYTGAGTSTSTAAQPSGTRPGTVVVYTPASYVTNTTPYSGTGTSTSTVAQPSGTAPGTVEVYTPASYVTNTTPYSGAGTSTSTVAQPSGTAPGTVVVYTPAASSGSYVTTITPYGGSGTSTSTVAQPSGTAPGTVVIYSPTSAVTTAPSTSPATTSRPVFTTQVGPGQCVCIPA